MRFVSPGRAAVGGVMALLLPALCLSASSLPQGNSGIAAQHPGDVGIASHPSVIFVEDFEHETLQQLFSRWEEVREPASMSFSSDIPEFSGGSQSLLMQRTTGSPSLYRRIQNDLGGYGYDHLFVRYYVKFDPASGGLSHGPAAIGGNNPATPWPMGGAGTRPSGTDRFHAAIEPFGNSWTWDYYTYWPDMGGSPPAGQTWGNSFIRDPSLEAERGVWISIEHMVKLNDTGQSNGEQALWINGQLVSHLGPGFPNGKWIWDKFYPGEGGTSVTWDDDVGGGVFREVPEGGEPFEGFRWRDIDDLNINFLWFYLYTGQPAGFTMTAWYDHIVVATEYIGPLVPEPAAAGLLLPGVWLLLRRRN